MLGRRAMSDPILQPGVIAIQWLMAAYVSPAVKPASAYIAPLKRRSVIRRDRKVSTAEAPTIVAPTGPSSTTAASVAAELADQPERLITVGAGAESQARNRRASAAHIRHHVSMMSPFPDDTPNESSPQSCGARGLLLLTTMTGMPRPTSSPKAMHRHFFGNGDD